jgi:DNA polymerase elongation subunit (family B)
VMMPRRRPRTARPLAEAWLLDAEADAERDGFALWVLRQGKVERHDVREPLRFHVHSRRGGLPELAKALESLDDILTTRVVERRLSLEHPRLRRVLEVRVHEHKRFRQVANLVDGRGRYRDYQLFGVDLHPAAQFLAARGLFPLCALSPGPGLQADDDPWALDYALPPLHLVRLDAAPGPGAGPLPSPEDPLGRITVGEAVLEERDGDEAALLRRLEQEVQTQDPHGLLTDGGDERLFPWLCARAHRAGFTSLALGRVPMPLQATRQATSFLTYGRIAYHAPFYLLRGRWHLDGGNSFFYGQGKLRGIYDLARISGVPVQTTARLGAGSAITMMQVHKAVAMGFLVPWKKTRPEDFKSGAQLLATDKGGYIYEPRVGLHAGAVEFDFASMYPNIMVSRNISPETINCRCCAKDGGLGVPGIGAWTCGKVVGLVPRYLKPVVERRFHHKRLAKALEQAGDLEGAAVAKGINDCLKWCLLVSFGYQGYRNARFGRLECHEAIGAWGRDLLLGAAEAAEQEGWEVLHGIVDSLWLKPTRAQHASPPALAEAIRAKADIDLAVEGAYSWIVFLPNKGDGARDLALRGAPGEAYVGAMNRYYGRFEDGTLKARGIEVRRSDTCAYVARAQEAMLAALGEADSAEAFPRAIPGAVAAMRAFVQALRRGEVPGEELVLGSTVSKPLEEYRVLTDATSALRQLAERGVRRQPGQWVGYVVVDHASGDPRAKARPQELWQPSDGYDADFYARRVARAAESLLLPFGWTEERLLQAARGQGCATLDDFAPAALRAA